jgi:hypothetical protein
MSIYISFTNKTRGSIEPFSNVMMMEVSTTSITLGLQHVGTRLEQNPFDKLVTSLTKALGPSCGLRLDDVNVTSLVRLMKLYESQHCDWEKYAFGDSDACYTRNLVDEGNGKSNLVCLSIRIFMFHCILVQSTSALLLTSASLPTACARVDSG